MVIALDEDGSGRGSGRSISAYDLHAGLAACAEHLTRFGGHRMAAGVELRGGLDRARSARALAAHAAPRWRPADLIPVERVDAVVPGGALGLGLAEELERAAARSASGNPQPTLLVPAARIEDVTGMGEERQHARFTLVTAGGARSRGVAFGSPPQALAAAAEHDPTTSRCGWSATAGTAWSSRAWCCARSARPAPASCSVLGEDGSFWERLRRALGRVPERFPPAVVAVAARAASTAAARASRAWPATCFTSGEPVLVAVADVPRRRAGLEQIVAGLAAGGLAVASWTALAADPSLAA